MLQTVWALSADGGDSPESTSIFTTILLAIIVGWIIITLFQRVIDNFFYYTLNFNETSTFDSLIIAITMTVFFIAFVTFIDSAGLVGQSDTGSDDTDVPSNTDTAQQDVMAAQGALLSDAEHPPARRRIVEWLGTNQNRNLCPVTFGITR